MLSLRPEATIEEVKALSYSAYLVRPDLWARMQGLELTDYQNETLRLCFNPDKSINRVSFRGPRGCGKTFLSAVIILAYIDIHETLNMPWQVLTTAPRNTQLTTYLWPEIRAVAHKLKHFDTEPMGQTQYVTAVGLATSTTVQKNREETIEGLHRDNVLVVIEEGKEVWDAVIQSLQGSFTQAGTSKDKKKVKKATMYMPSTPGVSAGTFWKIHTGQSKIWTPVYVQLHQALEAGIIGQEWVDQMRDEWGTESAKYRRDVLGEFAEDDESAFIPYGRLTESKARWRELMDEHRQEIMDGPLVIGLDPAEHGPDLAAAAFYNPEYNIVWKIETEPYTENVVELGQRYAEQYPHATLVVDAIGYGSGSYGGAKLVERVGKIKGFKGSVKSPYLLNTKTRVKNQRAASFFNLRQLLNHETIIALPDHQDMWAELQAHSAVWLANDVADICSKDQVKKIINRSPDVADAVAMAVWDTIAVKGRRKAKSWDHKRIEANL